MYQTKFGSNVKFITDAFLTRNLNVDEVSMESGISRPTLYRLLKSRQNIRYETAQKLTKFFGRGAVITQKYLDDMKNCAPDSDVATDTN